MQGSLQEVISCIQQQTCWLHQNLQEETIHKWAEKNANFAVDFCLCQPGTTHCLLHAMTPKLMPACSHRMGIIAQKQDAFTCHVHYQNMVWPLLLSCSSQRY